MLKCISVIVVVFLSFLINASEFASCEEVQTYRKNQVLAQESHCQSCKGERGFIKFWQQNAESELSRCMVDVTAKVSGFRFLDNLNLIDRVVELKLNNLTDSERGRLLEDEGNLSLQKIEKAIKVKQMKLLKQIVGLEGSTSLFKFYKKKSGKDYILKNVLNGPAVEVLAGLKQKYGEKNPIEYRQNAFKKLESLNNPFNYLVSQAFSYGREINFNSHHQILSPGHSRIILFEAIRHYYLDKDSNDMSEFIQFAKSLHLVFDAYDDTKSKDVFSGKQRHWAFTAHDGYFFGANLKHNWFSQIYSPEDKDTNFVSFDCSSVVQFCAFSLKDIKSKRPTDRLITYDFIKFYKNKKLPKAERKKLDSREKKIIPLIGKKFNVTQLKSERDLQVDDLVVYAGHMFQFKGYRWNNKKKQYKMITIEAKGDANRSLGVFERDVYPQDSNCKAMRWGRKEYKDAYRVREK